MSICDTPARIQRRAMRRAVLRLDLAHDYAMASPALPPILRLNVLG
jgi:hypothetical protein